MALQVWLGNTLHCIKVNWLLARRLWFTWFYILFMMRPGAGLNMFSIWSITIFLRACQTNLLCAIVLLCPTGTRLDTLQCRMIRYLSNVRVILNHLAVFVKCADWPPCLNKFMCMFVLGAHENKARRLWKNATCPRCVVLRDFLSGRGGGMKLKIILKCFLWHSEEWVRGF